MDLLNRQGPVVRVLEYLSKLALFLIVPGIHLVASGRKKSGVFVYAIMLIAAILYLAIPIEPTRQSFLLMTNIGRSVDDQHRPGL